MTGLSAASHAALVIKAATPIDPIEDYLRTAKPKAYAAANAALDAMPIEAIVTLSRALAGRVDPPAGIVAPPDDVRGAFCGRRDSLLAGVVARRLRDARTSVTDEALVALFDPPPDEDPARVALFGGGRGDAVARTALEHGRVDDVLAPRASRAVLEALAAHESPSDALFVPAIVAAQVLGDAHALDRFAALDDGSPGFVAQLIKLLAFTPSLSSGLITLVVRHAPSVQHMLSGPLTFEGPPDLLLELLERMPGDYLDEAILKGLARGLTDAQRARLSAFVATAAPRHFAGQLAKLASTGGGAKSDAMRSLGVVATDGAPVIVANASASRAWQGALPDLPARGDYHDACALGPTGTLAREGVEVLVVFSHESRVEVLDAGRGRRLLVIAGDPERAWAERGALTFEPLPVDLGEGPHTLFDAAYTLRAARDEDDRHVALSKKSVRFAAARATTDELDVVELRPISGPRRG